MTQQCLAMNREHIVKYSLFECVSQCKAHFTKFLDPPSGTHKQGFKSIWLATKMMRKKQVMSANDQLFPVYYRFGKFHC